MIIDVNNNNICAKATKKNSKFIYFLNIYFLTKISKLVKSLLFLFKLIKLIKHMFCIYIFSGLTNLGINNTPKIKSNNGAIIIKIDSKVIKI